MGYMAGTAADPILTFNVFPGALLEMFIIRFSRKIEKDPATRDALQKMEEMLLEMVKESSSEAQLQETKIEVVSFKHGSWENGLDIAFKAAIWLRVNHEEALANIWGIRSS